MTRPFEKHLDNDELDELVLLQASGVADPGDVPPYTGLGEAQRHAESCDDCQRKVQMHKSLQGEIFRVVVENKVARDSNCMGGNGWLQLVAGLFPETKARELMTHAARCNFCGPLLREAVNTLSDDATEIEEELLKSLTSGRPEWQRRLAQGLSETYQTGRSQSRSVRSPLSFRNIAVWQWAIATAVVVLVAVGWIVRRSSDVESANRMLAQAYTEQRTLELRIAEAKYGDFHENRGLNLSRMGLPNALLAAENLIADQLRRNPDSPEWISLGGRASLLEWDYGDAIADLQRALAAQHDSRVVMIDLATAYFERAERAEHGDGVADYQLAADLLCQVLAKDPDDAIAIFNRAVILEKLQHFHEAIEDWNHYLVLEPAGEWSSEARRRLEKLKLVTSASQKRAAASLMLPAEIANGLRFDPEETTASIDARIEDYMDLATRDWFDNPTTDSDALRVSLQVINDVVRARHGDLWFAQVVSERRQTPSSPGTALLGQAIDANRRGEHDGAWQLAKQSAGHLARHNSPAAWARARFEGIYADQLAHRGGRCYQAAVELLPALQRQHFTWLEIQTNMELGLCAFEIDRLGDALPRLERALSLAQTVGYKNLQLRADAILGDITLGIGDERRAADYLTMGLTQFWAESAQPMRGYSLLAIMETVAQNRKLWFLQVLSIKEALQILDNDPDRLLRGIEEHRLAEALLMSGNFDEAHKCFDRAQQLLASANGSESSANLLAEVQTGFARTFLALGKPQQALDTLNQVEPQIEHISNITPQANFYGVKAETLYALDRREELDRFVAASIRISEAGLGSLKEERERIDWSRSYEPTYRVLVESRMGTNPSSAFRWWEAFKGSSLRKAVTDWRDAGSLLDPAVPWLDSWPFPDTTLLSYFVGRDSIELAILDSDGLHILILDVRPQDLRDRVLHFAEACSDRQSNLNQTLQSGHELFSVLIKPALPWLNRSKRIIIEPDRALNALPFEVLLDDAGKFLGEQYVVTYSPGLYYLAATREILVANPQISALIVSDPVASYTLPLPDAQEESRQVAAHFARPRVLLRQKATVEAILQELPSSELLHFAGHASVTPYGENLLLSPPSDGGVSRLGPLQLDRTSLAHLQLVVLSACSTMHGIDETLQDRGNFPRLLLNMGVPQVVAGRWDVDSSTTRQWMSEFYGALLSGSDAAEAAEIAMSKVRAQWKHPYYWAAFGVIGRNS